MTTVVAKVEPSDVSHSEVQALAVALRDSDGEEAVIDILRAAGYWDDAAVWRSYGDRDNNWGTGGNQQSDSVGPLVEKLTNSIDARLMNECYMTGVDPTSEDAPSSVEDAVSIFFEGKERYGEAGGKVSEWPQSRITEVASGITLAATGGRTHPCISIADQGEGQCPCDVPRTFMSIGESNKIKIPFVQGKFNMGGTGTVSFCGDHGLQLLITRRNPDIPRLSGRQESDTDECWSITLVRRVWPSAGSQDRSSVIKYLAPVNASTAPRKGDVLCFSANEFGLMPLQVKGEKHPQPYGQSVPYGTLWKLYDYETSGAGGSFNSHILIGGASTKLLGRLDLKLPEPALPVGLYECRDYGGKKRGGSFFNPFTGLVKRARDSGDFVNEISGRINLDGDDIHFSVMVFGDGGAKKYRTNEGVIFSLNGQAHHGMHFRFFARKTVNLSRLKDNLIVIVDCTNMSNANLERFFMASRDRVRMGAEFKQLVSLLEAELRANDKLKKIAFELGQKDQRDAISDSKGLTSLLESMAKRNPRLARLFGGGSVRGEKRRDKHGDERVDTEYVGKQAISYFRHFGKADGFPLQRNGEEGRALRIRFETDVCNDYFERSSYPGHATATVTDREGKLVRAAYTLSLADGICNWLFELPSTVREGELLGIRFEVTDDTRTEPIIETATVKITAFRKSSGGGGGGRDKPISDNEGKDRASRDGGFGLPDIKEVQDGSTEWDRLGFDHQTAIVVDEVRRSATDEQGDDVSSDSPMKWIFYVNVDNASLKEQLGDRAAKGKEPLVVRKFVLGMVIVAVDIINEVRNSKGNASDEEGEDLGSMLRRDDYLTDTIRHLTRLLAPVLVPMIDTLSGISVDDISEDDIPD